MMRRWLLWPLSKTKDTKIVIMASQTALCDVNDLRYQMFRIKKGVVDSGQLPPCNGFRYPYASCYAVQLSKNVYGKYILNQKKKGYQQPRGTWMDDRRWTAII